MTSDKNRARYDSTLARDERIESYRAYLNFIADRELDPQLRRKVAPSDLVQLTMLEAVADWSRVAEKPASEQRAWLRQILRHNLTDARRTFFQCAKRDVERETSWPGHGTPDPSNNPALRQRTASSLFMAREEMERLDGAMSKLSNDQRQVVLLRSIHGHPFDEVGRQMKRSGNAARKLWARAIEHLTENLLSHDSHQRE